MWESYYCIVMWSCDKSDSCMINRKAVVDDTICYGQNVITLTENEEKGKTLGSGRWQASPI